jgi:hypothetical protein
MVVREQRSPSRNVLHGGPLSLNGNPGHGKPQMTDMNQPSPPSLQPFGVHVPPLPATPSLHLPATLRMLPWITDAATDYLDNIIGIKRAAGEQMHARECGAGSSTGYLAQRVTRLVTLDHDESWISVVATRHLHS